MRHVCSEAEAQVKADRVEKREGTPAYRICEDCGDWLHPYLVNPAAPAEGWDFAHRDALAARLCAEVCQ